MNPKHKALYPTTLRYQLIMTELLVAITYCRAAETTEDVLRKKRNIRQAKQAYRTAADFARRAPRPPAMRQDVQNKTDQLKSLLANFQVRTEQQPRS